MSLTITSAILLLTIFCIKNEVKAQSQVGNCQYNLESQYSCLLSTNNDRITQIGGQHGRGYNDNDVRALNIADGSKLKTFSSIFCQKFPNLEMIQIENAGIKSVDENSLFNCKNLKQLILDDNKITKLPENLLIGNSKLTVFWMRSNQLTSLPENFFQNQNDLDSLALNGNQISFVPSSIFRPLVKLQVLDLGSNRLQAINPQWFATLQYLKRVNLGGNQITEVPSKAFKPLRSLERLLLDSNRIKILNPGSFDGLQNLLILGLNGNLISDLPANIFVVSRNLRNLYLQSNNLATIHSDSFGLHIQLKTIYLQDNKINSIDEKIIDKTAVSTLGMSNNICSLSILRNRDEIISNLRECFDNYVSRPAKIIINSCGKSILAKGNIIGGKQIIRGAFPWIAALFTLENRQTGSYFCGGTILSNRKVVTAAHCIREKKSEAPLQANQIRVLLGTHDIKQNSEIGREAHDVQNIFINPDWDQSSDRYDADIAVLVLKTEVRFGSSIQPICMMASNSVMVDVPEGIVVGYGKSEDRSKIHENIPKILDIPIHKNELCFLKNHVLALFSTTRTFCGGNGNGIGVCRGDSGGGVFVYFRGAYYLRGIVSASLHTPTAQCDVNTYSIFTDASKFTAWIGEISTQALPERPTDDEDRSIWPRFY